MLPAHTSMTDLLAPEVTERLHRALDTLERNIAALREREMRRALIGRHLLEMPDSDLVASLVLLIGRVSEGRAAARVVLVELALDEALLSDLPYPRKASAYALARSIGALGVARMFLSARPRDNPTADESGPENEHVSTPLGVRRSAARSKDRLLLDRLLHDRNPAVIQNLLDNRRLVERDVVRIAAMRPTNPDVLSALARHARWSANYRVRKALACNPYTPRPLAIRLLPSLLVQDLRLALQSVDLDPAVEEEVRRLLDSRAPPRRVRAPGPAGPDAEVEAFLAEALANADALLPTEAAPMQARELDEAHDHQEEAPRNPFAEETEGDALTAEIERLIAEHADGFKLVPVVSRGAFADGLDEDDDPDDDAD